MDGLVILRGFLPWCWDTNDFLSFVTEPQLVQSAGIPSAWIVVIFENTQDAIGDVAGDVGDA